MIRVERHTLGPRCFVFGRRLHEWQSGIVALLGAMLVALADRPRAAVVLAVVGAWLVAKDYNDLVPGRRNTTAWSLGIHRRPLPLRPRSRASALPTLFAALTGAVGAINVAAALCPTRSLGELVLASHALTAPAGLALMILAFHLGRQRRRALWLAVGVLAGIGVIELVQGRDIAEAMLTWSLLTLLLWGRAAFTVRHHDGTLAAAGARHRHAAEQTRALVRAHGKDTLAAFKLRTDLSTFVGSSGEAFVAYRVQTGVLLIAGDPVGKEAALPDLMRELLGFAAEHGLRIGAVGASAAFADLAREAGLGALYLGDEAIVRTRSFTLEGKPIKKVRQAVNRVAREGFTAQVCTLGELDVLALEELEGVSARWRAGAPERGFSMAMDGIRGEHLAESVVVIARDGAERIRGFLHFVPAYGAPVMSLSAMRRDRDTPNGLTEFLIVRAIEALRERGIEELSLNFAAFARWLHSPASRTERVLARIVRWGNPYFQIESLYTFNAKFFPRWAPRYLLHDGAAALPRTALAALWVEGQIPRPALPSIGRATRRRASH